MLLQSSVLHPQNVGIPLRLIASLRLRAIICRGVESVDCDRFGDDSKAVYSSGL